MAENIVAQSANFEHIEAVIDAMVRSESLADFCRAIVHSELAPSYAQGCHIYTLNADAKLQKLSGYGTECLDTPPALSVWDDHPISDCVRKKASEFQSATPRRDQAVLAIPLMKESIPVGALSLVINPQVNTSPIHETLMPILSKLGTYCLINMTSTPGTCPTNGFQEAKDSNGEDLTSRQLRVLELMADGMVNVEIARELMVSESTVRQETVKIYRALGVPNRSDAAKKAKSIGLIKREVNS